MSPLSSVQFNLLTTALQSTCQWLQIPLFAVPVLNVLIHVFWNLGPPFSASMRVLLSNHQLENVKYSSIQSLYQTKYIQQSPNLTHSYSVLSPLSSSAYILISEKEVQVFINYVLIIIIQRQYMSQIKSNFIFVVDIAGYFLPYMKKK